MLDSSKLRAWADWMLGDVVIYGEDKVGTLVYLGLSKILVQTGSEFVSVTYTDIRAVVPKAFWEETWKAEWEKRLAEQ